MHSKAFSELSLIHHPRFINLRRVVENSSLPFFRSGEMTLITEEDAIILKSELKIAAYFDLRTERETEQWGKAKALENAGILWIHVPMDQITDPFFKIKIPSAEDYGLFYIRMLPSAIERFNHILAQFNDLYSQSPMTIAFGCGGGKDRTGIVTALLLKTLDYDEETIVQDYLKSGPYIFSKMDHFISRYKPKDVPEHLYRAQMISDKKSILIFLDHLKQNPAWQSQIDQSSLKKLKSHLKLC